MCGIAGAVAMNSGAPPIGRDVARMTRALAHRGPDDEGVVFWRRGAAPRPTGTEHTVEPLRSHLEPLAALVDEPWDVVLGHRRFTIVDTTPNGHQPFMDAAGRAALVFNGEIYNYVELREELERLGVVFRTRSDTEVLLNAYLQWGEKMFPRLNGMWAFALLDFRTGRVLLSRDRIGEKSLFHARVGDRLFFASEIKALLAVPEIAARRRVRDDLVRDYLFLGLRDHTHESMFEGIVNLPPATCAWVGEDGTVNPQTYWALPERRRTERDIGYADACREFAGLLADSVNIRLRADVPLAADLSGGMDSTMVVALATRRLREQHAPHRLRTFTVRYDDPRFDESSLATSAAEMSGAEFNAISPQAADYWAAAEAMIRTIEQPYNSPNLLAVRSAWDVMIAQGIRVVLNGGAGDELLAGYPGSQLMPFLGSLFRAGRLTVALREARRWWGTPYCNKVEARRYVLQTLPRPIRRGYFSRMFRLPDYSAFLVPNGTRYRIVAQAEQMALGGLDKVLRSQMTLAPMPMYMVQGDKLSMGMPIEVRFPYLDHRLIDFAFALPETYLIRNGFSKAILRDVAPGLVPKAVIQRREKMGFPVPLAQWIKTGEQIIRRQFAGPTRSARFVDRAVVSRPDCPLSEGMLWRAHQVELWMTTFDLD